MTERALASSIANVPHMAAYYDALGRTLARIDLAAIMVQIIDWAPSGALPFLAQQYDVLGYKGWNFCTTDEQRRNLLKAAPELHRTAGTPYAVKRAITALGFDSVVVTERAGIKYDGTYKYDGSKKYGGTQWFAMNVTVYYTGTAPTSYQIDLIRKLIDIWKAKRTILFDLRFRASI